jgi:hypothetical protein
MAGGSVTVQQELFPRVGLTVVPDVLQQPRDRQRVGDEVDYDPCA